MLWLFDSRDRLHGKRAFVRFPYTYEGKRQAWDYVLKREVSKDEYDDYWYLAEDDSADMDEYCEVFNDYWACYGWCLQGMEPDAEIPTDAEEVQP